MTYSKRGHLRFSKNICVTCISTNKNVRAFFLKILKKNGTKRQDGRERNLHTEFEDGH